MAGASMCGEVGGDGGRVTWSELGYDEMGTIWIQLSHGTVGRVVRMITLRV